MVKAIPRTNPTKNTALNENPNIDNLSKNESYPVTKNIIIKISLIPIFIYIIFNSIFIAAIIVIISLKISNQ